MIDPDLTQPEPCPAAFDWMTAQILCPPLMQDATEPTGRVVRSYSVRTPKPAKAPQEPGLIRTEAAARVFGMTGEALRKRCAYHGLQPAAGIESRRLLWRMNELTALMAQPNP